MITSIETYAHQFKTACEIAGLSSDKLDDISHHQAKHEKQMSKIIDTAFVNELRTFLKVSPERTIRFFNHLINFAAEEERIVQEDLRQAIINGYVSTDFFNELLTSICYDNGTRK